MVNEPPNGSHPPAPVGQRFRIGPIPLDPSIWIYTTVSLMALLVVYDGWSELEGVGGIVLEGDTLFACLGSGGGGKESAILKVSASGPEEVAVIKDAPLPYVPSPLLVGDRLYLLNDGGIFTAVKWPSGEPVYEPQRLSSAKGRSTKYFSSPVAADGKIFCCSQTGDVVTVKQGDAFEVLGVTELDAPINASPAISDDALYIRTEKSLYRINASGGKLP